MWPLWWWPQELMQPLMCRSMSPMSYSSSRSSKRSVIAAAIGIERALASAQKSPPGQAIMSVSRPMLGVAKLASRAACHSAQQVALAHPRQQQVLVVRDAQLAAAEAVGQVGGDVHLVGGGVAGRLAGALERQRHGAVAGDPVRRARCAPASAGRPAARRPAPRRMPSALRLHAGGQREVRGDAVELGLRDDVRGAVVVALEDAA